MKVASALEGLKVYFITFMPRDLLEYWGQEDPLLLQLEQKWMRYVYPLLAGVIEYSERINADNTAHSLDF